MKVFKFGGASIRDADSIRNIVKIVSEVTGNLVIVVSAFGKTTNALEKILKAWLNGESSYSNFLDGIYQSHLAVIDELFESEASVRGKTDISFTKLRNYLMTTTGKEYDYEYDQVVSYGEVWSTIIAEAFLKQSGFKSEWIDIREYLITDDRFRDANILWGESAVRINRIMNFDRNQSMLPRDSSQVLYQEKQQHLAERDLTIRQQYLPIYLMQSVLYYGKMFAVS